MTRVLLVVGTCFVIAATAFISMVILDNKYVHRSVAKREHTHYTKHNIDFDKEVCIEYYDNGSWFPVYICTAR